MATYFDPTADVALLRTANKDADELADVSAQAEADVIRQYTGRLYPWSAGKVMVGPPTSLGGSPERFVYLWGYAVDSAACTDASLVEALKKTIASVIDWRISRNQKDPVSGTRGDVTYRTDMNSDFPRGWNWRLREYDVRPDGVIWAC